MAAPVQPLPPYADLLRVSIEDAPDLLVRMPFHDDVVGRPGFLHGGAIAGLLEIAAFAAVQRALGDRRVKTKPVTVTVDYLRGGTQRDTFATAEVQRLGTRIANVEALAWQEVRTAPIAAARINFLLERP